MIKSPEAVAAQGGEYSYHGAAARDIYGDAVDVIDCVDFPEVVRASRADFPGAGVLAIRSRAGTIDRSAAQLVRSRPSALPTITGRTDLEVSLVLLAGAELGLDDLNQGILQSRVYVHGQKAALDQCEEAIRGVIKRPHFVYEKESIAAIRKMMGLYAEKPDFHHVAVGPASASEPLGAHHVSGIGQLNPEGSVTRFYALQRNPRQHLFDNDPDKTKRRTVVSLAHPEGKGEMDRVLEWMEALHLPLADFIHFDIGDLTRHDPNIPRAGGLMEIEAERYDATLLEFVARVDGLRSKDGAYGPFSAKPLGDFAWYPEQPLSLQHFSLEYDDQPSAPVAEDLAGLNK